MEVNIAITLIVSCVCMLAIWYINGAMLTPVSGENIDLHICVQVSGEAPELEQTVNGLLWLIDNGTMSGDIVILNSGMTEETKHKANVLARADWRIHFTENWEKYGTGERAD